jgi:hypothetical protein
MQITTTGLDLAKNVFQVHGVDAEGRVVSQIASCEGAGVLCEARALPRRNGSLRHSAFLGPRTYRDGASGEDHAAVLRESIR